jgi:hypothetical protein
MVDTNSTLTNLISFRRLHCTICMLYNIQLFKHQDHAIAQVVNHRLPTAAAWVRSQVRSCRIWTKWHWGRFPPSTSVSPANPDYTNAPYSSIIQGWYNRPISVQRTKRIQPHPHP